MASLLGGVALPRRAAAAFLQHWCVGSRRGLARFAPLPHELRRPFQQPNRRRDDVLLPRMPPAVQQSGEPYVHAWLSAWESPRVGIVPLRSDIWSLPLRTDIVHRVVTWQRACMRQGTSKTKGRHEVRGGGRKPRPQKGSGRSRQGSIRSPLYVGGGHAHPKRPRDFSYKLNLKVQSLGLKTALSDKWRRGALIVMRELDLADEEGLLPPPAPKPQLRPVPPGGALPTDETPAAATVLARRLTQLGIDLSKQRGAHQLAHQLAYDARPCGMQTHAAKSMRPPSPPMRGAPAELWNHQTM